jgi:hypothetical protein
MCTVIRKKSEWHERGTVCHETANEADKLLYKSNAILSIKINEIKTNFPT